MKEESSVHHMSHHPVKREETYSKTRQSVSKWKEWSGTSLGLMVEFIQFNIYINDLENKVESEVTKSAHIVQKLTAMNWRTSRHCLMKK